MNGKPQHSPSSWVELVGYEQDPLQQLALSLLEHPGVQTFDLSHHTVLLPHSLIPRFRLVLARCAQTRGLTALLPPQITTLNEWLKRQYRCPQKLLSSTARELLLFDALSDYPQLCERYGTWPLIHSLLALFDELSLNRRLMEQGEAQLQARLAAAYGMDDSAASLTPFSDEARLAYSLWQAWQQQCRQHNLCDPPQWLLQALAANDGASLGQGHLFLLLQAPLTQAELAWLQGLAASGHVHAMAHGQVGGQGYHPDSLITRTLEDLGITAGAVHGSDYGLTLDQAYASSPPLLQRAQAWRQQLPDSPLAARLACYAAADAEGEAHAIALQLRRWYLAGQQHIGIVTNDRVLARRVRALLERANIQLADSAGWALSTTSAASILVRWLECVQRDFIPELLFDVLKSPFLQLPDCDSKTYATHLERRLQAYTRPLRGLASYRHALNYYAERTHNDADTLQRIEVLLTALEQAAAPLRALLGGTKHPATHYLDALQHGLQTLGIGARYAKDEAGQIVAELLTEMQQALTARRVRMSWVEFLAWLQRKLEQQHFRPAMAGAHIELMGLSESRGYRFDAVIIAAVTREHLPGRLEASVFFNDAVRQQLQLPSLSEQRQLAFYDFRRLLQSAPKVLLTWRQEHHGEATLLSPWVERLLSFHALCYQQDLIASELGRLLDSGQCNIIRSDDAPLPPPANAAQVSLPETLLPKRLSASAYQTLIDCPYQFFARYGLKLAAPEDIQLGMAKADYGQRIHTILHAFHGDIPGLPGPFAQRITPRNREQALALLETITLAVFHGDLEQDFMAHAWLQRWHQTQQAYVDWQMQQAQDWTPALMETELQQAMPAGESVVTLYGRVDRIDHSSTGRRVMDYKTGALPALAQVQAGESVQLPFYSLLAGSNTSHAMYLRLEPQSINGRIAIEGEALTQLAAQIQARLQVAYQSMLQGAALPASGDSQTCLYCAMEGLCRKGLWAAPGAPGPTTKKTAAG